MSLFGGDSSPSPDLSSSISPIASPAATAPPVSYAQATDDTGSPEPPSSIGSVDVQGENALNKEDNAQAQGRTRFAGSDSLWRYYASDITALAQVLEDGRANDLAIHLYNAHAWKTSLRPKNSDSLAVSHVRKNRWIQGQEDGQRAWYPSTVWTTWPLEPEKVPRARETFWKNSPVSPPRAQEDVLRPEIQAAALRHVKNQWSNRRPSKRRPQKGGIVTLARSRSRTRSATPPGSDTTGREPSPSNDSEDDAVVGPVPTADIDATDLNLKSMTASVQGRLDTLLLALHHNRSGHYAVGRDKDSVRLRSTSHSRSRSNSVGQSYRHRSITPTETDAQIDEERGRRPTKRQKTDSGQGRVFQPSSSMGSGSDSEGDHVRAPRDWSEVLGAAALTGWEFAVVKRAQARCEALFGERTTFDTLVEDPNFESNYAEVTAGSSSLDLQTYNADTGLHCPFVDCNRHQNSFPVNQGFRFREHLLRTHKLSKEQVKNLQIDTGLSTGRTSAEDRNPRGWHPPNPLCCNHTDCQSKAKVYSAPRRLIEHLKRAHRYDPRTQLPPGARPTESTGEVSDADTTSEALSEADDYMVGGVHNDGFLTPIGTKVERRPNKAIAAGTPDG